MFEHIAMLDGYIDNIPCIILIIIFPLYYIITLITIHTSFFAVQRALSPDREVLNVMESWYEKPGAKFIFQLKLYTETMVNSKDPRILHMIFIQVGI